MEQKKSIHVDRNDSHCYLVNLPTLLTQTSNVIHAFLWAGLFSSSYSYLDWWCDWEELKREDEGRKIPQYSCSIAGGSPGRWKTLWKRDKCEKRRKRFKDPESLIPAKWWGDCAGSPALPRVALVFACFRVTLRLDEGMNGSLQKFPAEAAVQLGDGVSWKNNTETV